ncbi:unnamed protein product [Rotaria magnacalcarata]|uniref:Uncharacterized protein n=2 Tax=Rotaria magnacalcarata TaxID=392030 RepID=A0A815CSD6_9BILA|nr:unnamed protein product [Rotaria magnacalcarata]CAF1287492.1 unnamed protein product [Rotaria magnacalcarata]CAF2037386.1 unnamed protein product [Rotaria magnacalcarata]CAF3876179.1 unnamed protein product [Rotaria magnacalcarata]CAF3991300.1 unnamed protein product [Rotaria magnacalcarata]
MSARTPSFIVVGLVIIMLLLGLFYMSCSSKNSTLRLSLEQYEERIRLLTIKNNDIDKKLENMISRKRELEEETLTIQRQMEKKDSEVNDLNTKLNEKLAEIQSLKTDKNVLDEQLKDYKSVGESLASKNSLIEKLQQQLSDEKQSKSDDFNRLKQEYDSLKNSQSNQSSSNNPSLNSIIIPQYRFRPFILNGTTTKSTVSLFQSPSNKLNNLTQEIKPEIAPVILELQDKVPNIAAANVNPSTTTTLSNEQQQIADNDKLQQNVGQNVPAPPLVDNAQKQPNPIESAQAAPQSANKLNNENQAADNSQYQQRLQRSLNNSISDNKNMKSMDDADNENDDEEQLDNNNPSHNAAIPSNAMKQNNVEINDSPLMNDRALIKSNNNNNYRIGNRERYRQVRNKIQDEQEINNGQDIEHGSKNNNKENQDVEKPNAL